MKTTVRPWIVSLLAASLFSLFSLSSSYSVGLDDGYPAGEAAPGRTCSVDSVGQKTISSFSGKALSCILIVGVAKWAIDGDPLPPVETVTPISSIEPKVPTPVVSTDSYTWNKSVNIAKAKGSKFITIAGDRPVQVLIPGSLKPKLAAPLIVALHGFTDNPGKLMALMDLSGEAYKRGVVLAVPSGTHNAQGLNFWNATGSCCDFENSGVDDSKYLMDLVKQISGKVLIDQQRIYFVGHSNGGFMSYTVACNNSNEIAAIVNLNGSTFADLSLCKANRPVSVLQINGTADELIHIVGGNVFDDTKLPYPSVVNETSYWADVNGCSATAPIVKIKAKFNYESVVAGSETSKAAFKCPKGVAVEVWTIAAGRHVPKLNSTFLSAVFDFLLAHKK